MRISSEYSGRTRRRSLTSLSENRQLPRRSAPGIIAAEVHAMNEVATTFLTLGAVSYGGAGILGMMQAEIQQKRGWLSKERFLEGLALSNLLPGPTAAQLAMFLGYARAGWMGALVAGVCFVVPGFVVMLTLTLLYTTFAAVSTLRGAFYGLAPVVLGIFAIAVYRLGRAAIKDAGQLAFAVASAIAMAFPQVGIVTVVLIAGSVAIMLYASRAWGAVLVAATLALALLLALTSGVAMPLALDSGTGLGALALFFVIVGAFTFGGGLAMLGFIEQHAVTSFHWLTAQQFLDGLALGQLTPGPVVMLAAFVGYHVAAITGAVVAAAAVFLPSFALVLLTIPILQRTRQHPWLQAALRGVNPAVIGVIAVALLKMVPVAMPDLPRAALAVVTVLVMLRWSISPPLLIFAGAVLGLALGR
jgi:chromate transporter